MTFEIGDVVHFLKRNGTAGTGTIVAAHYAGGVTTSVLSSFNRTKKESLRPHIGRTSYNYKYDTRVAPKVNSFIIAVKTPRSYEYLRIPFTNVFRKVKEEEQQKLDLPPKENEITIIATESGFRDVFYNGKHLQATSKTIPGERLLEIVNGATIKEFGLAIFQEAKTIQIITAKVS
jgi:hypothetical protein